MQEYFRELEAAITTALEQALYETAPGISALERTCKLHAMVAALSAVETAAIVRDLLLAA